MTPRFVKALVANSKGEFFELDGYAAAGMAGAQCFPLRADRTINMPFGSEYFFLPDRRPVLFNLDTGRLETLFTDPHDADEPVFPVASFTAPGYTTTLTCAYVESAEARPLPLFSYAAVGWHRGRGRVAAIRVDAHRRQDLRLMPVEKIKAGVGDLRHQMPENRLRAHLERCALTYGCPAAKNFFLGRCEAPLPTSISCNARCCGCLSGQQDEGIPSSQERIRFTPSAEEIARVAVHHINRVRRRAIVSFGQGCEGEPLLAAAVIEPAIRRIRAAVSRGTIHMNTNASLPGVLDRLMEAGLDSIRVSLNSIRKPFYEAYYRPKGYHFEDVVQSIDLALAKGKFVSINYLSMPGFTDTAAEMTALLAFLDAHRVHMIQWRNLNFDPVRYGKIMGCGQTNDRLVGMKVLLETVRQACPWVKFGYFNPPKEDFFTPPASQIHRQKNEDRTLMA
ncbi:MAG: radical SAM protein [Deltaproteobacteria bacterium]|nr:radical SAM protein [Deltaproteobacteria bacterium]